jgi:hypothetical protein
VIKYTCVCSVRGWCGHNHRTLSGAVRCVQRDQSACRGLPGGNCYSDRKVVRKDGKPLDEEEFFDIQDRMRR